MVKMSSRFLKVLFSVGMVIAANTVTAQCAMCRTQIVNNVSHGETALAAGLNMGILYLFCAPYIMIGVVTFFWFKYSRVNERKESIVSRIRRQVS